MDIRSYFTPLLKWWWLILITVILAAGMSYMLVRNQPPVYTAQTTLLIGNTISQPNPSSNEFWLNQQLTSFYMDLSYREPVKDATMNALGLNWLPDYVVKPLGNNQFLVINVTDTDPNRAMLVAQELAKQLIETSPAAAVADDPSREQFAADQLVRTQAQIIETENQISLKQTELGTVQSARDIEVARRDLQALQDKLLLLRTNYANLLTNTKRTISNSLTIIEPASLPTKPSGLNKYLLVLVAGVAGLALGIGGSYLLEGLDDTIKKPKDVERLLGYPILGYLMNLGKRYKYSLYVAEHPRSFMAEAFRNLRTNLEVNWAESNLKTILVTSPEAGDGKSYVAVNLAVNLVQGGKRVLLIDGDLRKPTIHKYFDLEDRLGTTDLLKGTMKPDSVMHKWEDGKLNIITAGAGNDMPDTFLTPETVGHLLDRLKGLADVVIIDNPPCLVSDTLIFASKVDGILLVMRPGNTNRDLAQLIKTRLDSVNAHILGVVLNRISLGQASYYGEYRYYLPHYYAREKGMTKEGEQSLEQVKKTTMPVK
jgi:succinoglycan biosynthesis transport protein ExoP